MEKTIITAVVIAAVSFVMQKTLTNFIYGIAIWITRSFKKGDKISVRQGANEIASGQVIKRGILHVHIKDYNRNVCIIPNSVLENCTIVNSDYKTGVNYINQVRISYDSNIEKTKSIISNAILSHKQTENTEENTHLICKTDKDCMIIEYNVRTPDTTTSFDVCSDIVETVIGEIQKCEDIVLK